MVAVRKSAYGVVLLASLAFNAGMGVTFGVRAYNRSCESTEGCDRRGGPEADFFAALNLTPEQQEYFKTDRERLMQKLTPLFEQLRSASTSATNLMSAEQPDRAAISTELDVVASIRRQMQETVVDHVLGSMSQLDSAQRQIFNEKFLRRLPLLGGWGPGFGGPSDHRGPSQHRAAPHPEGRSPAPESDRQRSELPRRHDETGPRRS